MVYSELMVRRVKGWFALVVAAVSSFFIVTVEKAHGPAQSPSERREDDLAIQMPDEGEHPRLPMVEPPPLPIRGPTTLGGVGMAAIGSFPVGGSADTDPNPIAE